MECQRGRQETNAISYDACREALWPSFDEKAINGQSMFMGERT